MSTPDQLLAESIWKLQDDEFFDTLERQDDVSSMKSIKDCFFKRVHCTEWRDELNSLSYIPRTERIRCNVVWDRYEMLKGQFDPDEAGRRLQINRKQYDTLRARSSGAVGPSSPGEFRIGTTGRSASLQNSHRLLSVFDLHC